LAPLENKRKVVKDALFFLFTFFFGLCTFSAILSPLEIGENKEYMEIVKAFALFLVVSLSLNNREDITRLFWVLLIFAFIQAAATMYFYHLGEIRTRMVSYFRGVDWAIQTHLEGFWQ